MPWRRKWQPTPVFLPEKSHGQRNLAGYSHEVTRVRHDLETKQQDNIPIRRQKSSVQMKKQDLTTCYPQEKDLYKVTNRSKVRKKWGSFSCHGKVVSI